MSDAKVGIGGGATRATNLPEGGAERKLFPVASGVLDYFPDAIVEVSHVSWRGNEQHNPGQPLHWARGKSADEADTLLRHFMQRGSRDTDGLRHSAKVAWRALALLQKEIETEQAQERAAKPLFEQEYRGSPVGATLIINHVRKGEATDKPVDREIEGLRDELARRQKAQAAQDIRWGSGLDPIPVGGCGQEPNASPAYGVCCGDPGGCGNPDCVIRQRYKRGF